MLRFLHLMWLLFIAETATDTATDDADDPDADEGADTDDGDDEEQPRDPKAKLASMQSHLNRLHKKIEKQAKHIQELEEEQQPGDVTDSLRFSRLETAFLRAVLARGETLDLETAWDLANIRGFLDVLEVDEDGNVEGMDEMLAKVLDRYPWLADEPPYEPEGDDAEADPSRPVRHSRRPPRKRDGSAAKSVQSASLQKRLPAIRKKSR